MSIKVSTDVTSMTPSVTLALTAKANELRAEGKDVCGFTAGEPDFDPPAHIRDAAQEALAKGGKVCKYTPASGMPELKKAVCATLFPELSKKGVVLAGYPGLSADYLKGRTLDDSWAGHVVSSVWCLWVNLYGRCKSAQICDTERSPVL